MQKEFEKQEQLKALDEEHKKEIIKEIEEKEQKHKQHEPVSIHFILHIRKMLVLI